MKDGNLLQHIRRLQNSLAEYEWEDLVEFAREWATKRGMDATGISLDMQSGISSLVETIWKIDHEEVGQALMNDWTFHLQKEGLSLGDVINLDDANFISIPYTVCMHFTEDVLRSLEEYELQ